MLHNPTVAFSPHNVAALLTTLLPRGHMSASPPGPSSLPLLPLIAYWVTNDPVVLLQKTPMNQQKSWSDRFWDALLDAWWGKVLLGIFITGITYLIFQDFTQLEAGQTERIYGPKLIIGLYKVTGKWPVVIMLGGVGIGCLGWGIWHLITGKDS